MEKMLKSNCDKEYMRMAMLKHEETFKEQVNELHRLYQIQKMLMGSVEITQQQQKQKQERILVQGKNVFTIDHHQQQQQHQAQRNVINGNTKGNIMGGPRSDAQEHIAESNGHNNNNNNNNRSMMKLDESEIELTLSLGPSTCNPKQRKPGKSDSGQSISSSSTGSSQNWKTSPKNGSSITEGHKIAWGASLTHHQGSEIEPGFTNGQQNNPPWLFQALSLKLT